MAMTRLSEESIINLYKELVERNDGKPIGERVFKREPGISPYYWKGVHWRTWSAFQAAAGYTPNDPTAKQDDAIILRRFADLSLKLGHLPIESDLLLERKSDPSFPGKDAFRRWGSREALLKKVNDYRQDKPELAAVLALIHNGLTASVVNRLATLHINGFVYLIRAGKDYKIGRTNAVGRRLHELAIQLPQKPDTVHVIETDDPEGIERYWHERFAEKRQGGEWFKLTPEDVAAFKKRKFQ